VKKKKCNKEGVKKGLKDEIEEKNIVHENDDETEDEGEEEEIEPDHEDEDEGDEEEVFLVEIQGKNYYTDSEKNGTIYQCLDDEDIGDKVGIFDKNGVAIFD
jgi:hypothetical protein